MPKKKQPDLGSDWNAVVERVAKAIYEGKRKGVIEPEMVERHAKTLMSAIDIGYGTAPNDEGVAGSKYNTHQKLLKNVYHFSGAKNWSQLREMSLTIINYDGTTKTFSEYLKAVKTIDTTYNEHYLKAEYQQAIATAQHIDKWETIAAEADVFPFLEYDAVMDERTRKEHEDLHGIVRRWDDDFWKTYYPPNGWGCRCDVRQLDEDEATETNLSKRKLKGLEPMFQLNVGEQGVAFSDKHPYFENIPDKTKKQVFVAAEKLMPKVKRKVDATFFEQTTKRTVEEKQSIYSKPVEDQFVLLQKFKGGGAIEVHELYTPQTDHEDLITIARAKAKEGQVVKLLPVIDKKEKAVRDLLIPDHKGNTNADFVIGNKLHELETPAVPVDLVKIQSRISDGYKQADHIIILLKEKYPVEILERECAKQFNDANRSTLQTLEFRYNQKLLLLKRRKE